MRSIGPAVAPARLAACLVIALALGSALAVTPSTLGELERTHDRFAGLDATAREGAAGERHGFDAQAWDALRARLERGETYVVVTPRGRPRGFVDDRTVIRTYAAYRLLPAIQVTDRDLADSIVYVNVRRPADATCFDRARRLCLQRRR